MDYQVCTAYYADVLLTVRDESHFTECRGGENYDRISTGSDNSGA